MKSDGGNLYIHFLTHSHSQITPCFQNCAQGIASVPSHSQGRRDPARSLSLSLSLPIAQRELGVLQSSLSPPSSLTQKCERGLLNGPDRRWRPQCAAAAGDDLAVARSNKSTYCTHSTARGTGRRLGSQITENRGGKGERVRNGIPYM